MSDEKKKLKKLTKKELIARLEELETDSDTEKAHAAADDALLEYINDPEVTDAFESINKWYA